jgi:flagellar biosynthetic protein FliR
VLALMAAVPIYNNQALPRRIRLVAGLAIAGAIAISVPPSPQAGVPGSIISLAGIASEMLIGYSIGFSVRIAFAALDLAGDFIGLQMGLAFASFYDPQSAAQTPIVARFLAMLTTLFFLALNGHLLVLDVLARSFEWLPPGQFPASAKGFHVLVRSASLLFASGLLIALPVVSALLTTNIALGVLNRTAPQLNLFTLGFPITLAVGIGGLLIVLPLFAPAFQNLYEQAFNTIDLFLRAASGR